MCLSKIPMIKDLNMIFFSFTSHAALVFVDTASDFPLTHFTSFFAFINND